MKKIRYIIFTLGVDKTTIGKLQDVIVDSVNKKYDELYFLISSGGGSVIDGLNIAAIIKSLPLEITMHNIGQVDSVANVIFASAKNRFANENSSFLFHGISMNFEKARFTSTQLNEQYQIAERLENNIAQNFSAYTNIPEKEIKELMSRPNKIVNIDEAKKLGIIHEIKNIRIPKGAEVISMGDIQSLSK